MEKEKYSLDVIVAAYNAEDTIRKCLESILKQSYSEVKIIVVDDGSTDRTESIVAEISAQNSDKITLLTQSNAGPSAARNLGVSNSKSDFIGFVDADDYIAESMYSEMLSVADGKTDLVICGRYDVLSNGKHQAILPNIKHDNTNIFNNKSLLSRTSLFVWDKVYRRSIVEEFNIRFPESIKYAEDAVFLTSFKLHINKCRVVSSPLYFYTECREGSITRECNESWLDIPKALNIINKYYLEYGIFFEFWGELENLSIGYFKRRVNSLSVHTNKKMQLKYVKAQVGFMNDYFPGWRKKLGNPIYSNMLVIVSYILVPNFIKRSLFSTIKELKKVKSKKIIYRYFQKFCPLNSKVSLYISYSGDSISDNPFYMAKSANVYNKRIYFASRNVMRDKVYCNHKNLPFEIVSTRSIKYIWLLAVSGLVVTNSRVPTYFNKRKKQVLINTWHGTPIKTLGASMLNGIKDIGRNQNQFLMSDLLLFSNQFTKDKMYSDFGLQQLYSGEPVLSGYPRNDPFLYTNENRFQIRDKLKVNDKKVIVYMPTWRGLAIDKVDRESYINELLLMLKSIDAKIDSNSIVYVKLHQSVNASISSAEFNNIRSFPDGYDTYEFLSASDILITDYSSIMFDYLYSNKPIVLFLYDYKDYSTQRGFYFDINETPFVKTFNSEELVSVLNSDILFDYSEYISEFCLETKNTYSNDFWDKIKFNIKEGGRALDIACHISFCDSILTEEDERDILSVASTPNMVVVWHHSDINERTERFISDNKNELVPFVIVPGEMPITIGEKLVLIFNDKFNILNDLARKIYRTELQRILPGINCISIKDMSNRKKFNLMTRVFNKN